MVKGSRAALLREVGLGRLLRLVPFISPSQDALGKSGCCEFEFIDGKGQRAAVMWTDAKLRAGIVFEPGEGAPVVKTPRSMSGGPRTWIHFTDRGPTVRPPPAPQPPPAVLRALKAFFKKGSPPPVKLGKAKWTRPRLDALDTLSKQQLSAGARELGAKNFAALVKSLGERTLERVELKGDVALVGWVLERADGVFFDAGSPKLNGLAMSQGEVHDQTSSRSALVQAVQRALR
ncbi:MAG: hypothetical protein QM817_16490 [Archangium sp.]